MAGAQGSNYFKSLSSDFLEQASQKLRACVDTSPPLLLSSLMFASVSIVHGKCWSAYPVLLRTRPDSSSAEHFAPHQTPKTPRSDRCAIDCPFRRSFTPAACFSFPGIVERAVSMDSVCFMWRWVRSWPLLKPSPVSSFVTVVSLLSQTALHSWLVSADTGATNHIFRITHPCNVARQDNGNLHVALRLSMHAGRQAISVDFFETMRGYCLVRTLVP